MSQRLILPIDNCQFNAGYKSLIYLREWKFAHFGVDLGERNGYAPIHACGTGTIIACGMDGKNEKDRLGNCIVAVYKDVELQSGAVVNLACRMFHLSQILCKVGDRVTKDTIIGKYGNTGSKTSGAHLHIEFDTDIDYPAYAYGISGNGNVIKHGTIDSSINPSVVWFLGDDQSIYAPPAWIDEGWSTTADVKLPQIKNNAVAATKIPGIDVSEHQGDIDWEKVAGDAKFAFVRTGWSWYEGGHDVDGKFVQNISGAIAARIPTGVYTYAYDRTTEAAKIAAQKVLALVRPYELRYPVVYDFEHSQYQSFSKAQNTDIVLAFLSEIENAGYFAMLYASTNFLTCHLDMSRLSNYAVWVADYRETTGTTCPYKGAFGIWQYKGGKGDGDGKCAGVSGFCDRNYAYLDYEDVIRKAGLNHLGDNPTGEPEPPEGDDTSNLKEQLRQANERIKGFEDEVAVLEKRAAAADELLAETRKLIADFYTSTMELQSPDGFRKG